MTTSVKDVSCSGSKLGLTLRTTEHGRLGQRQNSKIEKESNVLTY